MNLKSSTKTDVNMTELVVEIDAESFEKALEAAYQRQKKNISMPGFRKGKVPRKLCERTYGENVFYEDAINAALNFELPAVIIEAGLEVVDTPKVEVTSADRENGVSLKVVCVTKPEINITDYKGIEAPRAEKEVTDEDVDQQIQMLRQRNARMVSVEDRAAEMGDEVNLDFEGFFGDEAFEGGKGENYQLKLGSGQFIPGFEEQVAGHEAGEEFEVNVTFPEQYQAEELAGKAATFKVKLHEVKTKELPAADDEFAKDVSEYDTLDELKASIRKGMEEQNEKNAELEVENDLVEQIVATLEGDIPPVMFETRIDEMVRDFEYRLQQQGLRLEDYIKYMGGDTAKFREGFKEQAEKQVKIRLALEAVAAAEGIAASEEDFENEVKRIADAYKMEVEKVRGIVPEAEVKKDLAVNKAIDFVKQNADVTVENVAPQKDEKAE